MRPKISVIRMMCAAEVRSEASKICSISLMQPIATIFAHCTLPINMPEDFTIMTHFESQIGVAFRGKLPEGPVTIFKCDGLMDEYFVSRGELLKNLTEFNLCRTQIQLRLDEPVSYFLTESIGNHHLIIKGDHTEIINEFFKWL